MLDIAEEKGVYSSLLKYELGQKNYLETFPQNLRNRFDFITATGLINGNHMDKTIFEQMLVPLKRNGYMVFCARFSYLGDYWYNDELTELETLGRI